MRITINSSPLCNVNPPVTDSDFMSWRIFAFLGVWLHHSPWALGCFTNNARAASVIIPQVALFISLEMRTCTMNGSEAQGHDVMSWIKCPRLMDSHHKGSLRYLKCPMMYAWRTCGTNSSVAKKNIFTILFVILTSKICDLKCYCLRKVYQCVLLILKNIKSGFELRKMQCNNIWYTTAVKVGGLWSGFWQLLDTRCTRVWLIAGANETTRIPTTDNRQTWTFSKAPCDTLTLW